MPPNLSVADKLLVIEATMDAILDRALDPETSLVQAQQYYKDAAELALIAIELRARLTIQR